jgi:hypothetical protein
MSDATTLFNKIDQKCSNVNLIDENLCLSNSLKFIVSNMNNLSSSLESIQNVADYLNNVYTLFTVNSSYWIQSNNNITKFAESWNDCYTLVKQTSSTWGNDFSIYYTSMFEINDWYTNETTYKNTILNWLTYNFPTSEFTPNQIISVYVNLYEDYQFSWTSVWTSLTAQPIPFSATFTHDCHLPNQSSSIDCTKNCPPAAFHGCNHHGGAANEGPCDNAWDHCGRETVSNGTSTYTCKAKSNTMSISAVNQYTTDRYTATVIKLTYQSSSNKWELIS